MVQRWVASAWVLTEKHFRRIDGHADLWALAAILGRDTKSTTQPSKEKVAKMKLPPLPTCNYGRNTFRKWRPSPKLLAFLESL